eukprot:TRINITY_DN24143_c0_g1_i8.p1 TRINITY_DN24143_c0_g1~~TRINITY_DN24143_c0_g1_i8.p1  ORF type:complete len:106 (-),score=24.16 TRINITY_DN24143_c0_g1_i8:35-352(-)
MTHTDLSEVPGMVFVEVDAVVVLATSVTATTRVLAVLADTTVSMRHITASLTALLQPCLLYTSDAADEEDSVDLGGRRIIKKKKKKKINRIRNLTNKTKSNNKQK